VFCLKIKCTEPITGCVGDSVKRLSKDYRSAEARRFHNLYVKTGIGVRSIAISVSVCLFVCLLSVLLLVFVSKKSREYRTGSGIYGGMYLPPYWANVCKTVRPMLSDRCPVCPVLSCLSCLSFCDIRALWLNGWTDQDETWHAGSPRPWPHCVRW